MTETPSQDDDEDFWGRPSAKAALEADRRVRREQAARDWRRNLVALLCTVALGVGAYIFLR